MKWTSPRAASGLALFTIALGTVSCVHPVRVSRGTLAQLKRKGEHYVLVFGSLSTPKGKLDRPTIRFLDQSNPAAPNTLLLSVTVSTGDRFYAVLHPPPAKSFLDSFHAEVGADNLGYDWIMYAKLREGEEPVAIYVGEIEVRPADERAVQGQRVRVETHDDFQNAERELRRLYPEFSGAIRKMSTRPSAPQGAPIVIPK
jgi:hypothetical protein